MHGLTPQWAAYLVVELLVWLTLPILAWALASPRGHGRTAFLVMGAGALHHLVGWLPMLHFADVMYFMGSGSTVEDSCRALRWGATLRPSASVFCWNYISSWTGLRLISKLPLFPTYLVLSTVDSLSFIGALATLRYAVRWAPEQGPKRVAAIAACCSVPIAAYHVFAQVQAVQPWGTIVLIELELLLVPLLAALAYLSILATLACIARSSRRATLPVIAGAGTFWFVFTAAAMGAEAWRHSAFLEGTTRWKPLTSVLVRVGTDRGQRPLTSKLVGFVPKYLPAIPSTGFGAYPAFDFGEPPDTLTLYVPSGRIGLEALTWTLPWSRPTGGTEDACRIGEWVHSR